MPRHTRLLFFHLVLSTTVVCLQLPSHDGPDVQVIYPPDLEAEAAAKLAKVPKNPDQSGLLVNDAIPMAEPLEQYPEGFGPLSVRPEQMRDTAASDCPTCGYKAPFLEHNGGTSREKEKVMLATAASMASVMAVLFAYLHFQPVIYLEVDPEAYLDRSAWIPNSIMLATSAIFIQMLAASLGAVVGQHIVFETLGYIGLFLFQIGLIMCCTAALES